MPSAISNGRELNFNDPRLRMMTFGRLVVRIAGYSGYIFLGAATATALFSDIAWLRAAGVLFALFLCDRFMRREEADRAIQDLPAGGRVNLAPVVTPQAFRILERAYDRSALARSDFLVEVFHHLLRLKETKEVLARLDVKADEVLAKTEEISAKEKVKTGNDERRRQAETLVSAAFLEAQMSSHRFVDADCLFAALPAVCGAIGRIMNIFSLNPEDIAQAILFARVEREFGGLRRLPAALGGIVLGAERGLRHRIMNRAWTSRPTPTLDRVSTDFTDLARREEIGFLIGHESEYQRLLNTLSRAINPNALLVGEAGIGKETIVAHFAFALVKDRVPPALFDKRLVGLDVSRLVAGVSETELQRRIQTVVSEIIAAGNVILYLPEIHNLVRTSGTAYLSAADALMPIIMNNAFPVIGATYPREFKEYVLPRSDFAGAFEVIRVEEVSPRDAERILIYGSMILERKTGVLVSFGAVKTAVRLAKRHFRTKFLPSSAEELLKEGVVRAARRRDAALGADGVIAVAEEKTNVPLREASGAEAERLLNLESVIHERLIDQDEAVKAVADALREYRSGLARGSGPIATFLFVGPTGVGKTELSKILARVQFGDERAMVRFDMTEYQEKAAVARFIGSSDGRVAGALTEAVLEKPYSLVLLDEFEKAHPDILNLFLQVFDDGRLTDYLGRTVDFTNTLLIATSNAHSDLINDALTKGQTMSQIAEYLKRRLTDVFRPELLNRFSRIIVFKNLAPHDLRRIVELQLAGLRETLEAQGIAFGYEPEVVSLLAKLGYEPAFGARPLRRVVEEKLRAPLAQKLLKREVGRGGTLRLTVRGDEFAFVGDESDK